MAVAKDKPASEKTQKTETKKAAIKAVKDPVKDHTNSTVTTLTHGKTVVQHWIEDVSPAKAKGYLENLVHNQRDVSRTTVQAYANDMKSGRWNPIADPIRFYNNGEILELDNGQHRLHAIIQAGVTVPLLCMSHNDKSSFTAVDNGRVRKLHEVMEIDGVSAGVRMSSFATACRMALGLELVAAASAKISNLRVRQRYSNTAVLDFYRSCPNFGKLADELGNTYNTRKIEKIIPLSVVISFYYFFSEAYPNEVRSMIHALSHDGYTSDGLGPESPMYKFVTWIRDTKEQRVSIRQSQYFNGLLWALSMLHRDQKVQKFNWRADFTFGSEHIGADAVLAKIQARNKDILDIFKDLK